MGKKADMLEIWFHYTNQKSQLYFQQNAVGKQTEKRAKLHDQ
jgi:hypothetical protein